MPPDDERVWDEGWAYEGYRRSRKARFSSQDGAFRLTPAGVGDLEAAATELLADRGVRLVWSEVDLWTWLVRLLAAVVEGRYSKKDLDTQLLRLKKPRQTTIAAPVANVLWGQPPLRVGRLVISDLDVQSAAETLALLGEPTGQDELGSYLASLVNGLGKGVVIAMRTPLQSSRAHDELESSLEDLLGVVILLTESRSNLSHISLRGSTNRPGLRGVSLDRGAIESISRAAKSEELGLQEFRWGEFGRQGNIYWHSADPMDLGSLADELGPGGNVASILSADDEIARRVKTAARWYAAAHWSESEVDAVLALGVALDALVGAKSGLPGIAMRQRFALLEPVATHRPARAKRHQLVYEARSAIAHGGHTKKLEAIGGARGVMRDVRWAALQLIALRSAFPREVGDLDGLFGNLSLGVVTWPVGGPESRSPRAAT